MHPELVTASVLIVFIGIVHSWLGEIKLINPLVSPATRTGILAHSRFARQVLRFAWHLTTLSWWGMAVVLAVIGLSQGDSTGKMVAIIYAGTFGLLAAITLYAGRGRHHAWWVFAAIAALTAYFGLR